MADIETVTKGAKQAAKRVTSGDSPLSKPAGLATAGAALAALPFVAEKLTGAGSKVADKASDLTDDAKQKAKSELKDTAKEALPNSPGEVLGGGPLKKLFGGGGRHGRRRPGWRRGPRLRERKADADPAVDRRRSAGHQVFSHWTEYEDWPEFMHRIESAEQVDETTVSVPGEDMGNQQALRGRDRRATPRRADRVERHQWLRHTGVVTSTGSRRPDPDRPVAGHPAGEHHRQGQPRNRYAKRAVRGDLHRFKAYVELDKERKRARDRPSRRAR